MLFDVPDLLKYLEGRRREAINRINNYVGHYLVTLNANDLCEQIQEEFTITLPVLRLNEVEYDYYEADVDISGDFTRTVMNRNMRTFIKGTEFLFTIPFDGDEVCLQYAPNVFMTGGRIQGHVEKGVIKLSFQSTNHDGDKIQARFDQTIKQIQERLDISVGHIRQYNESLIRDVRKRIDERLEKLMKDSEMAKSIRFPLRKRETASVTIPVKRKQLPVKLAEKTTPFKPEPELEMQHYEEILGTIANMAVAIERSPSTFVKMGEEDIRMIFLVALNGQYEGAVTGETFNGDGKTDILVRVEDRNIFIGECKFWAGPKSLRETIDQLLGYSTWRDTKTAILLFSKKKNLSAVLDKIPEAVAEHPNFKRRLEYPSETGFRFILGQRDDKERNLILTVLVFDMPV